MYKVPYHILALSVEQLYAKSFPPNTTNHIIEEHCYLIQQLIEASGWEVEEYFQRWSQDYFSQSSQINVIAQSHSSN